VQEAVPAGDERARPVHDAPEPEVCEESPSEPLAGSVTQGIELSLRSPARGGGMAPEGGSVRRETGTPGSDADTG
jgi:hypothetical protein